MVCGIEISHVGKNNGNPDLMGEKKISCFSSGRLHRRNIGINFFDKLKSLQARIHKTKSITAELNITLCSHQQMNTNFSMFYVLLYVTFCPF